jgi:hypothetical protein
MTAPLTDRDMLTRTLFLLEGGPCCGAFESMHTWVRSMCPGPRHRPVPMLSCSQATAAWELRRYLERHGGWCPEHGTDLGRCHPAAERPDPDSIAPTHPSHPRLCYCAPVTRTRKALSALAGDPG